MCRALARLAPAERQQPGGYVLAADRAIQLELYSAGIQLLLAVPAPRHGAPWIHERLRADFAVARVVLRAGWIGRGLSGACVSRSRGLGRTCRPRCPVRRLLAVELCRNTNRR